MYEDDSAQADVKLADFGLSRRIHKLTHVRSAGGAERNYATAPEIFKGQSFPQSDLWSIGVITYILLSRQAPFCGETMMEQITRCRFSFDDPVWESISVDAKDFISQLLQLDPNKRPTVAQTMKHRWLIRRIAAMWTTPEVGYVTPEDQKRMDEEISAAAFKQQAINIIAEVSSMEDILKIAQWCLQFDESKSGKTTYSEFKLALQTSGYSSVEVSSIFQSSVSVWHVVVLGFVQHSMPFLSTHSASAADYFVSCPSRRKPPMMPNSGTGTFWPQHSRRGDDLKRLS